MFTRLLGRKDAETNVNSEVIKYSYSAANDLIMLVDGKNQTNRWEFDQYGRVTNQIDATNTSIIQYTYDPEGRLTWTAGSSIIQYAYDAENRMTNRWTAAKGNTTFRYEENGNLTNVVYAVSPSLTFRYDGIGALTNMVDAVGTNSWSTTYTTNGTFRADDGPWANDVLWYAHNTNGLLSSVTVSNGAVYQVSYTYDVANRVSNIVSSAGMFAYTYSGASSLLKKIGMGNSSYVTNTFDSMGRLLSTQLRNSGNQILNGHTYAYNVGNQRTSQTRVDGSVMSYSYDPIGQLKTAVGIELDGTPRLHEKFGYAYDAAGNLQYKTNNALVQTFNTDSLNQLSTVTRANSFTVAGTTSSQAESVTVNGSPAALYTDFTFAKEGVTLTNGANTFTAIGTSWQGTKSTNTVSVIMPTTATFTYDANGNMTSDGYLGHDYDDENQLIRVTSTNSWKREFTYDGMRRRRIRKEYAWSGGAWSLSEEVRYVYDGMLPLEERDGSNTLKVRYTRGLDMSGSMQGAGGIGGLLARTGYSGGTPSHAYYHADGNGNITFLADTNQAAVATYLYDSYGKVLAAAGPLAETNRMQFSSKESDLRTGLSYYGYRYYVPSLQRWLNNDPAFVGPNLSSFTSGAPVNGIDAYGLLALFSDYQYGTFGNRTFIAFTATIYLHINFDPVYTPIFSNPFRAEGQLFGRYVAAAEEIWSGLSPYPSRKFGSKTPNLIDFELNIEYQFASSFNSFPTTIFANPLTLSHEQIKAVGGDLLDAAVTYLLPPDDPIKQDHEAYLSDIKLYGEKFKEFSERNAFAFAHEIGHVLGHADAYFNEPKELVGIPFRGWDGNLMAQGWWGSTDYRNIVNIMWNNYHSFTPLDFLLKLIGSSGPEGVVGTSMVPDSLVATPAWRPRTRRTR